MVFHESSENYLKAILILKQRQGEVRCVDLAEYMGYSKASVSTAVAALRKKGFLEPSGYCLTLTRRGEELSSRILEKHRFFMNLLISCGVDQNVAREEACSMEHAISDESFKKIKSKVRIADLAAEGSVK